MLYMLTITYHNQDLKNAMLLKHIQSYLKYNIPSHHICLHFCFIFCWFLLKRMVAWPMTTEHTNMFLWVQYAPIRRILIESNLFFCPLGMGLCFYSLTVSPWSAIINGMHFKAAGWAYDCNSWPGRNKPMLKSNLIDTVLCQQYKLVQDRHQK